MIRILRFACPSLSVGLLAAGFFLGGLTWPAVGLLLFGIVWLVGLALHWDWFSSLALFALFGAAACGLLLGLSPVVLIAGAIFALVTWDLAEFHIRLRMASPEDGIAMLEKRHLLRIALLVLAGGGLSAFALTLHLKSSFEWTVILMIFAVWGIARMVDWLLIKE